jgi:hypothetical protein
MLVTPCLERYQKDQFLDETLTRTGVLIGPKMIGCDLLTVVGIPVELVTLARGFRITR